MNAVVATTEKVKFDHNTPTLRPLTELRLKALRNGHADDISTTLAPRGSSIEIDIHGNEVILRSEDEWTKWYSGQLSAIRDQDLKVWTKTTDFSEHIGTDLAVAVQMYDLIVVRGMTRTTYTVQTSYHYSRESSGWSLVNSQSTLLSFKEVVHN